MNTVIETKCVSRLDRFGRVLLWSGLGICVVAATLYDIYGIFG